MGVNDFMTGLSKEKNGAMDDIDAKIRALEADLNDSDDSSSSSEEDEGVICLSTVNKERIEPLPSDLLPQTRKRKRKNSDSGPVSSASLLHFPETLKKLPFVCRPCAFQGSNLREFNDHRESPGHLKKAKACMSLLKCRPCKKSFNSPAQMEEHLKSKVHRKPFISSGK